MDILLNLLITIVVVVGIFLLCRELMCWYWKINEMLSEQKKTNQLLTELVRSTGPEGAAAANKILKGEIDQAPRSEGSWEDLKKKK